MSPNDVSKRHTGIDDWIAAAQAARHNCYLHAAVGPDNKPKLGRTDVISSGAIWTDVDPGDKDNPITSEADFLERRSAILTAMRAEEPPFSCIVDSGNGFQAYKFIEPFRIDGDSNRLAVLEAANKAINDSMNQRLAGMGLKADKCYSADHLMRLPGTTNFLTAKKRSHGYPTGDRPAHIVDWHPERVYKLENLLAGHLIGREDHADDDKNGNSTTLTPDELRELLNGLDAKNYRDGAKWRSLLWAAHHGTNGTGRDVFVEWSASDPEFANDGTNTLSTWDRAKDDRENGITVATLIHELNEVGRDDLVQKIRSKRPELSNGKGVQIGSDVEIARRVREDLVRQYGPIIHADGAFWRYSSTHWEPIPDHELRRAVHPYDGARFGKSSRVRLGKGRIDSVLNECATLCANPDFFNDRPIGINCASGFIRFADDGSAAIETHNRDHRCRHTLPGHWHTGADGRPPDGSLLFRLLNGVFEGDPEATEKVALLSEVCGSAALGFATQLTQPRAVILFGKTAENGKSQILDLARGLLPPSAICSVPAARMGDERHIVGLVGKLLNATDELSSGAIASDKFKSVVTGEPVEGRDVYKSRVEFRSIAQNLFATNGLPPFLGGMDRGVQRRLLVIPFNRTIPMEQRVENIGRRIAGSEADLLLAWAVDGASRLVRRRNFSIPASCKHALEEWIYGTDPVLAWLSECIEVRPVIYHQPAVTTREAFDKFHRWAIAEGYKPDKVPAINGFVQRVLANAAGVEHHRNAQGRRFLGFVIKDVHSGLPF